MKKSKSNKVGLQKAPVSTGIQISEEDKAKIIEEFLLDQISCEEVAEILGVSIVTVRNLAFSDKLPYIRIGHPLRFSRKAILEFKEFKELKSLKVHKNNGKRY